MAPLGYRTTTADTRPTILIFRLSDITYRYTDCLLAYNKPVAETDCNIRRLGTKAIQAENSTKPEVKMVVLENRDLNHLIFGLWVLFPKNCFLAVWAHGR